jgi:hypothetical protein
MTEKSAALLVSVLAGTLVLAAAIVSNSGLRPYDEAINAQIDQENSALCAKFGFDSATEKFKGCMGDLADLRKRETDLSGAYGWL